MRFLYIVIICIFVSANALAADPLPLDKDGFGGIKWGTEYSDKLGMKECTDIGSAIICKKKDERLKEIGGVPVEVKYRFQGAYFSMIIIIFNDASKWPIVTNALTKAYGKSQPFASMEVGHNEFYYKNDGVGVAGMYVGGHRQVLFVALAGDEDVVTKHFNKYEEAATKRFNKMALSLFTEAERKNLDGFLGVKWGMTVEQIPHKLLPMYSYGEEMTYHQVDNFYFGFIRADIISYTFTNNKLDGITLTFTLDYYDIFPNSVDLFKDILELNFGKFKVNESENYYLFLSKTFLDIQKAADGTVSISASKR